MATFGPIQGLGTIWYFEFFDETFDTKEAASTATMMREFEANYSRFQPNSLISILNRERELLNPSSEFVDLLKLSISYFTKTEGVFNIAVGEKMEAIGYDANYSLRGGAVVLPELPNLEQVLKITADRITLTAGKLDLGGIGKGYLIDKLATFFKKELGIKHFLINGGGDMYATDNKGEAIEIQLAHPLDKTKYIATVNLLNQGFAASSPYLRAWKDPNTGKEYNHLHTENKVATYITSPTATEADVYATVLSINPEAGHENSLKKMLVQETNVIYRDEDFKLVDSEVEHHSAM